MEEFMRLYLNVKDLFLDGTEIVISHKKLKGRSLTPEKKQENKIISSIRITVEHAIVGMKIFAATSESIAIEKAKIMTFLY